MAQRKIKPFYSTLREQLYFDQYLHEKIVPQLAKELNTTLRRSFYLSADLSFPKGTTQTQVFKTLYHYVVALRLEDMDYPEYCMLTETYNYRSVIEKTNLAYLLHHKYDFFTLFTKRAKSNGWEPYSFPKLIDKHKDENRDFDPYR